MAATYRRLVLLVGAQLLVTALGNALRAGVETPGEAVLINLVVLALALGTAVVLAINGYRLAELLDAGTPALWAVGMFIPCVSIVVLLVLSSKAQAECKRYGIRVGLMGPRTEDIDRLR